MKKLLKIQKLNLKKDLNSLITFLNFNLIAFIIISVLIHLFFFEIIKFIKPIPLKKNKNISFKLLNNNTDNLKSPDKKTKYVSDENSTAQGQLTKEKGDNFLSKNKKQNILKKNKSDKKKEEKEKNKKSIFMTFIKKKILKSKEKDSEQKNYMAVPENYEFNKKLALNFSSDGEISFDTKKYKNAAYFKRMVKKIAKYWYSAIPVYAHYMGLIPSGEVQIVFIISREGKLLDYKLIKDFNYSSITKASIYAITHAAPYEPLPSSIKGETLLIPFSFKYINPRK